MSSGHCVAAGAVRPTRAFLLQLVRERQRASKRLYSSHSIDKSVACLPSVEAIRVGGYVAISPVSMDPRCTRVPWGKAEGFKLSSLSGALAASHLRSRVVSTACCCRLLLAAWWCG